MAMVSLSLKRGWVLFDTNAGYAVDPACNRFTPYFWDEDDIALAAGATTLDVQGAAAAAFPPLSDGYLVLLQTNSLDRLTRRCASLCGWSA